MAAFDMDGYKYNKDMLYIVPPYSESNHWSFYCDAIGNFPDLSSEFNCRSQWLKLISWGWKISGQPLHGAMMCFPTRIQSPLMVQCSPTLHKVWVNSVGNHSFSTVEYKCLLECPLCDDRPWVCISLVKYWVHWETHKCVIRYSGERLLHIQ